VVKLRALLVPLALAGMLLIPGLALARIYSGDLTPRLVGGAALGSVLVSVALRRLPSWSVAPVSVLALTGYTAWAVKLSAQSGGVPGPLATVARDALANGIPRLLTAMIPIEPQPDTVVAPVLATWLAGLAAAELAVRGRRVLLSYIFPTLLLGGVLYLVGPNARASFWLPVAFAACAAVGLAASAGVRERVEPALTRPQRSTLRVRVAAGAAVGLAVIVALATALAPSVAGHVDQTPTDPRRYVQPPQIDALDESPLVRLSGWALNPDQRLFDADLTGVPQGSATRIRLGVMSDYDGVTWRVGARYRNAGRVLTGPVAQSSTGGQGGGGPVSNGRAVEQRITIGELDGRLLPAIAQPEQIDGVRIAYDPSTGTMALPDGLHPDISYTVTSREAKIEVNVLPSADVPDGDTVARYLSLPGTVPSDMQRLATQLSDGVAAPYQRAQAIAQFLGEHYRAVADAPSGHAYPNLNFFLFGPRNGGGQRGTSEQFAAAFAVLARVLALPTRVVVGFEARPGRSTVTGKDAIAWPEVLFSGIGWVPFDPMPQPNTQPRSVEDDFKPLPVATAPPPSVAPTPSASVVSASPRPSQPDAAGAPPPSKPPLAAVGAGTGVGTLILGYLIAVPLLRRSLRRRRIAVGSARDRVAGAWLEVLDGLRLAGRPASPHLAATELAEYAARAAESSTHAAGAPTARLRLPAPVITDLAKVANLAAFGPADGQQAVGRVADEAVAQAMAYVDELRARRPWSRRVLWALDPRPLSWARRHNAPIR
jgi:transglutaminase-like putative cysteine protease